MIPLRAEGVARGRVVIVWLLMAACIAALARIALLPDARATAIVDQLAVVPARLLADPFSDQLLTLVTAAFLHAGWLHLAGNMLFLAVFGPGVEARLGHLKFAGLYLACGAAGALGHIAMNPASTLPVVGASGAIAGVLGAFLVFAPKAKVTIVIPMVVVYEMATVPAAFMIALWFALQLAAAVAPIAPGVVETGVAWYAHISGFVAGLALAACTVFGNRSNKKRRSPRRSDRPAHKNVSKRAA